MSIQNVWGGKTCRLPRFLELWESLGTLWETLALSIQNVWGGKTDHLPCFLELWESLGTLWETLAVSDTKCMGRENVPSALLF